MIYLGNLENLRECGQSSGEITEAFSEGINSSGEIVVYTELDSLFPFVFKKLSAKPSGRQLLECDPFSLWVGYHCENTDQISSQISNISNLDMKVHIFSFL